MTVIFHDVHKHQELQDKLKENRPPNYEEDEVLYADDTILFSTSAAALQKFLRNIEEEGEKYGLQLNQGKCEISQTGNQTILTVKFRDGTKVKQKRRLNT